jgi:DNA-binding FadR family transcriptional regulator
MSAVRRDHLHNQVTRAIALRILRGTLTGQSDATTEGELCREFEVSRTVVREAVKVLAAKGLIEVRSKTGIRVRPRSDWNLLDPSLLVWQAEVGVDDAFVRNLCHVRLILEPPTAAAAAIEATDEERQAIRDAFLKMEQAGDDFDKFAEGDSAFHSSISRASHNDLLTQVNRIVFDALCVPRSLHRVARGHEKTRAALDLHRDVAEAIARRDSLEAHQAMVRLIKRAEKDFYFALHDASASPAAVTAAAPALP